MSAASVTTRKVTLPGYVLDGEHLIALVIIGPDLERPEKKTLHLRVVADVLEVINRTQSPAAKQEIIAHLQLLVDRFAEQVQQP